MLILEVLIIAEDFKGCMMFVSYFNFYAVSVC